MGRFYVPDGQTFNYSDDSVLAWKDEIPKYFRDAHDFWFSGYRPKPGDCIVDVGAGRGEDVLPFSDAVGPEGKVFAIEAQPETFGRLKRFCELNRIFNVIPIHAALMDEPGIVHIEDDNSAEWIANTVKSGGFGHPVQALRFDDLCQANNIPHIDFLKMNIEGAERYALLGMTETLLKLNDVCICAHDFRADRGDGEEYRTRGIVIDVLTKNGFAVTRRAADPRAWVQDHIFGTRQRLLEEQVSVRAEELSPPAEQALRPGAPPLRGLPRLPEARGFVGTDEISGRLQFDLLRREGLCPNSVMLEVGCGCLNAGVFFIEYLERGNYVGIDPNEWLREAAIRECQLHGLIEQKSPIFLSNTNFDAISLGMKFDFAFSHSILSHTAHWQLEQYLKNVGHVLKPHGLILASIRLAEGNAFGNPGSPNKNDSEDREWVYPGVSWFKLATVQEMARKAGLAAVYKPEYTAFYTLTRPAEYHDWIVFSRLG